MSLLKEHMYKVQRCFREHEDEDFSKQSEHDRTKIKTKTVIVMLQGGLAALIKDWIHWTSDESAHWFWQFNQNNKKKEKKEKEIQLSIQAEKRNENKWEIKVTRAWKSGNVHSSRFASLFSLNTSPQSAPSQTWRSSARTRRQACDRQSKVHVKKAATFTSTMPAASSREVQGPSGGGRRRPCIKKQRRGEGKAATFRISEFVTMTTA